MAFVDIPTLNGSQVHVAADSVYRVTSGIGTDAPLTRVISALNTNLPEWLPRTSRTFSAAPGLS